MVDLEAFGDYWHYKLVGNFRHSKPFGLLICKIEGLMAEAHMSIIHREEFLTSLVKSTIFVQRSSVQMEGLHHRGSFLSYKLDCTDR